MSTKEAALMLGVSEQVVRRQIDAGELAGASMQQGCWRIPTRSVITDSVSVPSSPIEPPYLRRIVERLGEFETGMIPCADAALIAGIGVKAMRNTLRSGRVPGGRLVGGCWLVTVADFGRWLGISEAER